MPETFNAFEYLGYLRQRWSFAARAGIAAVVLTIIACWWMTPTYTAIATMVIEPPAGSDPRASTAVSAVYLESLKSYEEFASSDTLFAKAAAKFQLLNGSAVEAVKRRVLRVNKPQGTNVLEIAVTLPDPKQAQAMAQYLAEETVALTRSIARVGERDSLTEIETQLAQAREELEKARTEQTFAESAGTVTAMEAEARDLADLRFRISEQLISANALLAEQSNGSEAASSRARIAALEKERARVEQEAVAKRSAVATLRARLFRVEDRIRATQIRFETLSQRVTELAASSGTRTDQVRLIDPGVVPQQPSFPRPTLFVTAAFLIALMLSLTYLTLQFGLQRQRTTFRESELRVARGNR